MIKKIKVVHIVAAIVLICIFSAFTNYYLHINYADSFVEEEDGIEEGKSERFTSEDGIYDYRIDVNSDTIEIISYNIETEKELVIPKEMDGRMVTSIGETAFVYHTELKTIYVPETIKKVRLAFVAGCYNLEEVVFQGDVEEIEEAAFVDFNGKVVAPENSNILSYAKENKIQVETIDSTE